MPNGLAAISKVEWLVVVMRTVIGKHQGALDMMQQTNSTDVGLYDVYILEVRDVFQWIMDANTSIAAPPAHRSTSHYMFCSMLSTYLSIPGRNNNQS